MKSLAYAALFALALTPSSGFAEEHQKMSDEELIKLSLSAAPEAIAKDATVVVMDHDGKMRTLREGTGQWTCMPGHADPANPDPMCGDKNAMEWASAWMNHKEPPANKAGCTCSEETAAQVTPTRMQQKKSPATIGLKPAHT